MILAIVTQEKALGRIFALVKFCLFSMGLAAGTQIPEKHKKKAIKTAACVFAATYIPLMTKVFRLAFRRA